jgi:hypothetical protein
MKYIWNAEGGMVPNIGTFNTGDEVPAEVAQKLKDAGYTVQEVADAKPVKSKGEA